MSFHIGCLCDLSRPLGWALESKCRSPNSALFSEADTFQLLIESTQPPHSRSAAQLSQAASSQFGAVHPQEGARERWIATLSQRSRSAMQSRQLSAADLTELTKDLHKLLILDGSPKGEGSLSCLQSSLPLKHFPLSLKVKIKWIFLYHFTDKCFDK